MINFDKCQNALQLLAPPGQRDAQLTAVLGDCTPCHLVSVLFHLLGQLLVGQRLALVLGIDALLEHFLELPGGHFFALLVLHTFREEVLQGEPFPHKYERIH